VSHGTGVAAASAFLCADIPSRYNDT
jgi:hypothetical protein